MEEQNCSLLKQEKKMKKFILFLIFTLTSIILIWPFTPNLVLWTFNSKKIVKEIPVKKDLLISQLKVNPTYQDGFSVILPKNLNITIDDIVLKSFKSQPLIIQKAMGFGELLSIKSLPYYLNVGDQFGQFQVIAKNETEIVLGEKDFPFYLLSYSLENNSTGTRVNIHNLTNFDSMKWSTFFRILKPFHIYLMLCFAKGILI